MVPDIFPKTPFRFRVFAAVRKIKCTVQGGCVLQSLLGRAIFASMTDVQVRCMQHGSWFFYGRAITTRWSLIGQRPSRVD